MADEVVEFTEERRRNLKAVLDIADDDLFFVAIKRYTSKVGVYSLVSLQLRQLFDTLSKRAAQSGGSGE